MLAKHDRQTTKKLAQPQKNAVIPAQAGIQSFVDSYFKHKHWRGFPSKNAPNTAPVLEFANFTRAIRMALIFNKTNQVRMAFT
ncbi:MAG TPA: hypothetical protein VF928_10735 [Usitatibacteraceae bacterium]